MKTAQIRRLLFITFSLVLLISFLNHSASAADLLDKIKQRGTIQVGMEGTYPPFNFVDNNGKLSGFEVDFTNALAKHLDVKAVIKPTKWDGILAALESGRIDLVINQVAITAERQKKYDFSVPYTISGIQVLMKKKQAGTVQRPEDLRGKKVGVGLGSNYESWLREHVPGVDIRTYDDDPGKYQDLLAGRTDAILVDKLAALDLIKRTGDTLALSGKPFSRQPVGIALRKGNPQLLAAIDQAIATMRQDGSLRQLSLKWFGADVTDDEQDSAAK